MPPSDKNKTNSEASEDSQREEDCSKPVTMDTTAPLDPATSSAPDLTLPDHGTIANIPLFTANINIPTLKCSINDQMKTFDPGEVSNTERLNNNNQSGSSIVFPVKCSNSIINNKNPKNNYKAGSKINKLADMLAKRSQNIVEVTSDIKNNDFTVLKTNEEPAEVKTEDVVVDLDKTVNDKPVELVKKSRRKSVPNQSCTLPEPLQLQSNNSKSCSDISELFTDKKEIALEVPLENKSQTDESTKNKKVIRKNLKNVELSLILPEKKRRSSPRCKKISENNPVPKLVKKESPKPAAAAAAAPAAPIKLRKSKRLVETSTQTADIEFISLVVSKPETENGKPSHACLYCSETFSSGSDCKSHEKTHAVKKKSKQLIKCQFCSKKVPSLIEIKSHCVKSHPNKYFVCVKCDERYPDKEGLNSHVKEFHPTEEPVKSADLKIDVTFDSSGKKSSTSPRILLPKSSPRESKTEEQLLEAEMLFYSHLSGNIQENLANHLDGKIDKNGNPVRTDQIIDPTDSGSLLSVAVPTPVIQISRAPSPYQTRSKTPNPLPPTAKKFKKLPNWQQKFWEKYNFPTNYRFEHRFWDKNYLNTEKSPFYLKDLSCLDIKTQLTMRENIKKLDIIKASEETSKNQDRLSFPDYLSLVPKINSDPEEKFETVKIPEYGRGKRIKDLNNKKSFKSPQAAELPKNKKSNAELRKQPEKTSTRIADGLKMMTRRQSSVDLGKEEKKTEENVRRRKGSLDMSTGQKMVLRRQTSLDNLQGSSKTDEDVVDNDLEVVGSDSEESSSTLPAGTAEISGEWVRPRSYLCGTCCLRFTNLWELEDHKWTSHPNVWCTHYEFEDDKIDKLFTKNDDDVDSSPDNASSAFTKHKLTDLYKRYLLPHGSLKTAKLIPTPNFPEQCTKCKKNCTNASELHKHMLDCGGDTTWFLTMYSSPTSMKRKWRPFGSRRRKQIGRRMVKRNIPSTPTLRPYQYQHRIRTKPGDVESIQKMLANLPEKRARRAINFDEIKTRSQATIHSNRLLRKRFKVSFGSNFMRLKNLKTAQQRLKPIKKESSSKSNTDTSSESTPIGSPKRKIRTKDATQPPKSEAVAAETVETAVKDEEIKSPKKKPAGNPKNNNKKLNSKKKLPAKANPKAVAKNNVPETVTATVPASAPDKKKPAKKKPAAPKTQPKIKTEIVVEEENKNGISEEKPTSVKKQSILRLRQNDKDKTELIKKIKKKLNNSKRILESKLKSERRRSERIKTLQESPEMPNGEPEVKLEVPEVVNGTPEILPEEPVKKSPKRKVDLSEMPILDKEEPLKGRTSRKNEPEIPVLMPFENGTDEGKDSLRFKIVSKKRKTPEEKVTPLKIVKETEESKNAKKRKTETKNTKSKKHFLGINPNEIDKGGEEKEDSESDSEPLISLVAPKKIEEPEKRTEEPEVEKIETEVKLNEVAEPESGNKEVEVAETNLEAVLVPGISPVVTEIPELVQEPNKSPPKITKELTNNVKVIKKPKAKPKPKKIKSKVVEKPEVMPEIVGNPEVIPVVVAKPKKAKAKAIKEPGKIEEIVPVMVPKPKKGRTKAAEELIPEILPEVSPEVSSVVLPVEVDTKPKKVKSKAVDELIPEILSEVVPLMEPKPKKGRSKPVEELMPEIVAEVLPVMEPKLKKGKPKAAEELIPEISPEILLEVIPVVSPKQKNVKVKAVEEPENVPERDSKPKNKKSKTVEEPEIIPKVIETPDVEQKRKKVKSKAIKKPVVAPDMVENPVLGPKPKKSRSKAVKLPVLIPEVVENLELMSEVVAKPKKIKSKAAEVPETIPEVVETLELIPEIAENPEIVPEVVPKSKKIKSKAVKLPETIPEVVETPEGMPELVENAEVMPEVVPKCKKTKSKPVKVPEAMPEIVENLAVIPKPVKIKPIIEKPEINLETIEIAPKLKKAKSKQPKKPVKRLRMKVTLKEPTLKIPDKLPLIPSENKWTIKPAEIPESPSTAPERRSRRISKETKSSNEFVIDDPFLLVDELWSELDSDSDSSKKKNKKYKKKSPRKKTKTDVDLEKILRNFGEKKEEQKIMKRIRKIITNQDIREKLELAQKSNPKSFNRLSLRLFRFNKKPKNLGYQGIKLSKAIKDVTDEKKAMLPGIPYLASEITENPVQIIQCGRQKSKRKNLKKLIKPQTEKPNIQLKVSVPLESINNLAVLNNNHLTEVVMEELPPPIPEEPPPPPPPPPAPEIAEPTPMETEVLPKTRRSEVIDKIFYCEICKTYYYSSSQLKNHKMSNRHKQKELELTASVEEPQPSAPEPAPEIPIEPVPEVINGVAEPSQPEIVPEIDKINEDTSEMPILEGPFIENPFVRLGMERIEPAPKPPPPPPPSNPFGFSEDCLKDIQKAIGCTDEEMLILTLLGENSIEIENDILDLDSCQPVKSQGNKSDSGKSEEGQKENAEKSNGIFKIDLKKRMTSALACLVNKAVFNLLQKSGSASKAGVNPEALSFLNKLSSVSHKKNILQLNELLKKQSFGESSVGSLLKDDEKPNQRIPYKYQCTICGSRFEKASTRECHIIRTHRAKSKKSMEESQISQTTYEEEQSDWNDTWSYDGNDDVLTSQTAQFWCSDCGINFHSPQEVLEHQKLEHQTIKEPEPVETTGPLQSSTIGSSDEIVEGKKPPPKRRSKHFSTAELDQQRILANNELRKLDRKFSNKNKPCKAKWGMDALKFTVEKENKSSAEIKTDDVKTSSIPEDVSSEEQPKASPAVDKTLDIVPKLNLSRTNNIPEFKVIQKNTFENRFQKIIDNKIKRKSTKNDLESEEPEVPELPEVPEVVKKPEPRKRRGSNKSGKKSEERKVYDVYDFNESESETEPIVLSHVKKTQQKKGKEGNEPSKNKADSTTKDLAPDDYDSEDSLPLAVVKKGKEEEEEDEGQKSEGILEQVEYLIEQLEGEDDKEKTETESFRISLENKFLQLDNIPLKKKDGEKVSDEEDSLPLKIVKDKAKETEAPPELLSCKSPEFKASEESLPPLLSNEFDNLNGNVIYRRNSVSDFESEMSNDGLIDSEQSLIQEVMEKEDVVIVCSKKDGEDGEKTNGKRKRASVDSSQRKKKIIPLLSATIEENNFRKSESPKLNKEVIVKKIWSRKKTEEGKDPNDEIDKEMIMKKIWSRKKTEDAEKKPSAPETPTENVKINQTEISDEVVIKCGPKTKTRRKSKTSNESSKETIMRRIWSGKCTFQTKAALKTYETDIIQAETEEVDSTQTAKRKRQTSISASKRAKTDDEISEDEDDLDSLLEEIERENVEKAIRLEFLQLRRSDKNPEISKEITEVGLFTETLPEVKEIPDKKRRKVRKNPTKRIIRRKVTKKPTKKALPTVETEADDAILTSDAILTNDGASDVSEGSLNELERGSEEADLESKIKSHKHKKHRHKHHHHKHKHKKSKHHGDNKHKNKHKLENGESLSLWEKICQDLPEDLKNEPKSKLDDLLSNPPLTYAEDDDDDNDNNKTSDIWQGKESEENVYDFVDEDSEFSLNKKKNFKK